MIYVARKNVEAFFLIATTYYDIKEFFLSLSCLELHYKSYVFFQNYTLRKLEKHTNYIVTVAARNYVGLGPSAVIELRTEDGGKQCQFGCGILKMVGPEMQDFCPRIDMLKGNCFKIILQ